MCVGDTNCLSYLPSETEKQKKTEYLAVARLLPTSSLLFHHSIDRLHDGKWKAPNPAAQSTEQTQHT